MATMRSEIGGTDDRLSRTQLTTDGVFETLSNRRRRYVLHYLKRIGEPTTVRDLSEQLAAWEFDVARADVRPKQRKRLYTALHQTHLAKMDQLGVVTYDRNRGTVELTDSVEQFDIYFDMVGRADIPWSQFYLALGVLFTSLTSLAVLGIRPFSTLLGPTTVLAAGVLFTAIALYHVVRDRQQVLGSADRPPEPAKVRPDFLPESEDDD